MNVQRLIVDESLSAAEHMAVDEQLATEAVPTVRFFQWNPPAISLGFKQEPPAWLEELPWQARGLELVERPTGGGIAFHGSDLSLSVVVPREPALPLSSLMDAVCESAVRLCETYGLEATALLAVSRTERVAYCFTQPSPYAVFLAGRKIAGFALRRFPRSWLVQGSLLVGSLPEPLTTTLPRDVLDELKARAIPLSEAVRMLVDEEDVAQRWADAVRHLRS